MAPMTPTINAEKLPPLITVETSSSTSSDTDDSHQPPVLVSFSDSSASDNDSNSCDELPAQILLSPYSDDDSDHVDTDPTQLPDESTTFLVHDSETSHNSVPPLVSFTSSDCESDAHTFVPPLASFTSSVSESDTDTSVPPLLPCALSESEHDSKIDVLKPPSCLASTRRLNLRFNLSAWRKPTAGHRTSAPPPHRSCQPW